jgi:glycosyltransferase involved in cell wall biosynthesis
LKSPLVSIVVPALNEAKRLERTLPQLCEYLANWSAVETIIVDDGSIDGTAAVATRELAGVEHTVVRLPWHQGKGAALRAGVAAARGRAIVFMDADLAAGLDNLPRLLDGLRNADISVGSRHLAESQIEYDNELRAVCSKWFGRYVRAVTRIEVSDTQCGFKAFRSEPAKMLFHLAETSGFAMDVELLSLARLLGYSVAEVPISWADRAGSKVNLFHDPVKMAVDVLRLHLRLMRRRRGLIERVPGDSAWMVRVSGPPGSSFFEAGQNGLAAAGTDTESVLAPVTPLAANART